MRFLIGMALVASLLGSPTIGYSANTEADAAITNFHDALLGILSRNSSKSDQARYDALESTLDSTFNYEVMIKTIAGRYWRKADSTTQEMLRKAFRNVSIATYADQYAGLTDGKFKTEGHRDGPRGLKLVDTKLITSSKEVGLTYVMREKGGKWQIIDVLLDGGKISELARKASEYAKTLKDGGAQALITVLEDQKQTLLAN